jgi:ubiquinone/menaquinone biosynthesis C-methylase UbiE
MSHPFDADELFGEDYLHFYGEVLGDDRSDEDTDAAIGFAHLSPGMHVLDAPCGHGRMAVRMAERGLQVTGIDRAAHFLDHAREEAARRGVEVDLREGDLRALPVEGPFDAVVCWFTSFGYFDDDDNLAVLREFRRVLRPGGHLVVETLSHDGYVRTFTESPEAIVVEVGGDLLVDRNEFDATTGSIVCRRVTIRDGQRREARFAIRLPTVPEWYRFMADAGFASVEVTDREGAPVELSTWRVVVTAVA